MDTLERYREAVRDEHDCSHLSFCSDCSFVYGLVQQLKHEGYIQCIECGEWAKSETDYCSDCRPCRMCECDQVRLPCPDCGACFDCAQDDCGACLKRLAFLRAEAPSEQPVDLVSMAKSILGVS